MNKTYIIGGVAIVVVLALGMIFPRSGGTVVERVIEKVSEPLGAGISFETDTCTNFGGNVTCNYIMPMFTASSTVCEFRTRNSTTTIDMFVADFAVQSTTTAGIVTMAYSSVSGASTTALSVSTIPSGSKETIIASTTAQIVRIPPRSYVNVSVKGQVQNYPTGVCKLRVTETASGI